MHSQEHVQLARRHFAYVLDKNCTGTVGEWAIKLHAMSLNCQRHLFSLPPDATYLNSAYMGPLPLPVQNAVYDALAIRANPIALSPQDFFTHAETARALAARLVNANKESVALVPTASWGVGIAWHQLKPRAGQNVVMLDEIFPSNAHPWRKWRELGVEMRMVKAPSVPLAQRSDAWTQAVIDAIDENTLVVALEQAHWTDGTLFDLPAICATARVVGAYSIVDVTQTIGAYPIDAKQIGADLLVAHCYKSMLCHYGLGFAVVGERLMNGQPFDQGWLTRNKAEDFSRLVDYRDDFAPGARRFDTSTRANPILIGSLIASLDLMLGWGAEAITSYLRKIREPLCKEVEALGFALAPSDQTPGNIFGLHLIEPKPLEAIRQRLAERKVYVSVRGSAIRVSPHMYNDLGDMERLIAALRA